MKNKKEKENNNEYGEEEIDKVLKGKLKEKGKDNKKSINLDAELPYFEDNKNEKEKVDKLLKMNNNNQIINKELSARTEINRKNYNNIINMLNTNNINNNTKNNEPFIVKPINNPNPNETKEIKKDVKNIKNPDSPLRKRPSSKKYTFQSTNKNNYNNDLKL